MDLRFWLRILQNPFDSNDLRTLNLELHFLLLRLGRIKLCLHVLRLLKNCSLIYLLPIEEKAKMLLAENIGQDLSRIHNEIDKLAVLLKKENDF